MQVNLIIVEVFPEDQGQYICVAQNPAGQATSSAYLTVLESEETTMELELQEVGTASAGESQEVTFVIQAPVVPEPVEAEEKPAIEEPIVEKVVQEEDVVPMIIDRPKMEPLVKEEPVRESPVFESPIPESLTGTESSDIYYTAQEEVEEEVAESAISAKLIERAKLVPLVPERILESPELEIVPVEIEEEIPESVTPTEEVQEEPMEKVITTREIKLPDELAEKMAETQIVTQETTVDTLSMETKEITFTVSTTQEPGEETEVKIILPKEVLVEEVMLRN